MQTVSIIRSDIDQKRVLGTAIPGPQVGRAAPAQAAAVSAGVGTGLPVYVERRRRRHPGRRRRQLADRLRLRHRGDHGRQRRTPGGRAGAGAGRRLHPHLLHGHPVRGVRAGRREAQRADPGRATRSASALFNSGAEAVENAVKIARLATGRQAVVAFDHAYHGRTNLTMALTAKNMPYKHRFGPFANEIYRVPMAYPFRWPSGAGQLRGRGLRRVRSTWCTPRSARTNTAAVLIEPIQGEGGFIVPAAGFRQAGRRLVRRATASCSSPTRSSPASAGPATGSPASTRTWCRT